jgi:lipopolysaccharide export system protein LptC
LVSLLRVALPLATLLLATLVIAWPKFQNRERSGFNLTPTHADPKEVEQLTMVNPKFVGLDSKQEPYSVTARTANQDRPGADLLLLDQPQADITLTSGAWITVTALNGRYAQKEQMLDLIGDINLFHDSGFEFHTEQAQVDLANNTMSGDVHVTGHGPAGTIDSEGFMVLDHGQTVLFTGRAKLHLNPSAKSAAPNKKSPAAPARSPATGKTR